MALRPSQTMRINRPTTIAIAAVAVIGGWALFRPELLFVNKKVNEAAPSAQTTTTQSLGKGEFASYAHETKGTAEILSDGGKRFVRLTNFSTSNGPEVHVLLVEGTDPKKVDDKAIELGDLKGNQGDQNYEIPASADLGKFKSITIWCKRFAVAFGGASLSDSMPKQAMNWESPSTSQPSPYFQLASFVPGPIEVTFGSLQGSSKFGGRAAIQEVNGGRILKLAIKKLGTGSFEARLVKKETLKLGAFPTDAAFVDLGSLRKGSHDITISKDIDVWLYRTVAIVDKQSSRIVAFILLRSAQEGRSA